MNKNDPDRLLGDLLRHDALYVRDWVGKVLEGHQRASGAFNWLGLAEGSAFKARQMQSHVIEPTQIGWAHIATMIYEHLALEANETEKESLFCSSMMLRAFMISKLG